MDRIILHWSAGPHRVTNLDRQHYHFIVSGAGELVSGVHPVSASLRPQKGKYAAHTLNCNTGSIGIAMAAMAGAVERPFNPGPAPITEPQLERFIKLAADLAREYDIPVTRKTILTHAEVERSLNIKQRGKWDICWLPGMPQPLDPIYVGDLIRERIGALIADEAVKAAPPSDKKPGLFSRIFGGKK